ncbi:aminopeptidase N [Candidatus Pseudothioglobus singularis]|nr:aminopeptidase N [Candidatus Pseudothioglobus singularis]MDB4847233.1 aminopeptidase N [Candidatus Pseudothioglobus singularis]
MPEPIFRKDYRPSSHLILTTELDFNLGDRETIVSSSIVFYKNPVVTNIVEELFLNGESLELISIKVDGLDASYELKEDGLFLLNPPDDFVLEVQVRIHPESKTDLNGLYQSSGNFCTQCEAMGFRQITYYLDRPDVLSVFTTKIKANREHYPVLLSNGNLIEETNNQAIWHDPAPKPCYLFALVAGKLDFLQDGYITSTGRKVDLRVYVEPHNMHKTAFAMESLIKAFEWDEKRFNLSYDLDIYMIVAVDDFNMGAMENKGLNIFNSDCVLASQESSTDLSFIRIESIIGHEYFHNWTGNRVTCRDWFQLSLKEGLTVFRDQEFSSDLRSRAIQRITDVIQLKTRQFAEDSGPMAHPVRPESYIAMDNFYTSTVYEKGAEVIRMIHSILGEEGFQRGMKLYFERHDGDAVTIDDFVASMANANDKNFESFMLWYSQAGTPEVSVEDDYDENNQTYSATFTQKNQKTPYMIPNQFGLIDKDGEEIESGLIIIDELVKTISFNNIKNKPIPSWFRGFSSPIKFSSDLSIQNKIYLASSDTDPFNRWESAQSLWLEFVLNPDQVIEKGLFQMIKNLFKNEFDYSLLSEMISLPSEQIIHQNVGKIDVQEVHNQRNQSILSIASTFKDEMLELYDQLNAPKAFDLSTQSIGERALKNKCLSYLSKLGEYDIAYQQFINAECMTDQFGAFQCLLDSKNPYRDDVITQFYKQHQSDVQVMDKWFSAQCISSVSSVENVRSLMQHELFSMTNPNRIRSVIGSFSQNSIQFHCQEGYQLLTEVIIELDQLNPQIAARFAGIYNHWRRYMAQYCKLQESQLNSIIQSDNLSKDVYEIVHSALKGKV